MLLLLFFFSSCKTRICICVDDCSSYCPDNIQTFYYPSSSNNNIIQSLSQNETEIHVFLSSTINDFVFDFDLSMQSNLNVTFESLNIIGLLTVNVHLKDEIQSISLNPKEQITICAFLNSKHLKNKQKRINLEDPDFFRDKTFTEDEISETIIIDSKSSIREISNCNFSILSNSMKTLFTVQTDITFENMIVEIYSLPAIEILYGIVEIRNCVFNHIGSASTAILINSSFSTSVFMENCIFNEQGAGNFVFINNQSPDSTLSFLNCSFFNENSQPNTRFLYSISEDVTIDSSNFFQPAGYSTNLETIRIYPPSSSIGSFSFINNDVFNAINRFIGLYLYQTPIFANNTFHDFNRERSDYFMVVTLHTPDSFLFENNTYKNIVGGAHYNGGISTWVASSSYRGKQITIKFVHCTFINVTNIYQSNIPIEYRCQGGVFQHGYTPSLSNSSLIFNSCIFNDNGINGCGGALAFEILGDLAIINCSFISNKAKLNSQVVGCLSNGGAIFLANPYMNSQSPRSVTIQHCNFTGNEATEGSVFYYYPNSIEVDVEVIFESCTFQNNGRIGQSQIVCYSPSFTFFNNTVQYTSDSEIGSSNEYSIILPSAKMIDISHCYFFNQNELNATGGGFLQVSQHSNSMVYDNCFNLHDLVFNSSKHYSSIQLFLPQLYSFSSNNVTICNYEYNTPFCTIQLSNEANVGGSIINLNNWSFYNCTTSNNTGVSLYTSQRITFTSCSWYNNSVSNGNSGLINFKANSACQEFQVCTIDSISFINCIFLDIHSHSGTGFALFIESHNFEFDQCTFTYSTECDDTRCQAIAILSDETIVITNSIINGTRSYDLTGGIYLQLAKSNLISSFLMTNVTFSSIQSSGDDSSDVCFYLLLQSVQNVVIDNIHIDSCTGKTLCSIFLNSSTISFNSWTVTSNILTSNNPAQIDNWCNFPGSTPIEFNNCLFELNSKASDYGCAFHIYNIDMSFINCQFIENSARHGGALAINNVLNTIYITNCTFSSNQATQNGGAIYFASSQSSDNNKTITIENCTFSGCRSHSGGAMYINSAIEVLLEGVNRFECCRATQYGSILFLNLQTTFFNLPSTTIIENQTDGSQFLIYCYLPHFRCYNLNLTNNITQNCFYIYGENGHTELKSIHFENVAQAIYICNIAENTEVLDCTFYNCHPSSTDSIVSISSIFNVLFSNNTFDSIKDGRPTPALYIHYYSQNVEISHNRFLNCDSYKPSRPAIRFAGSIPPSSYVPSYVFKFNYNYLKNVGSNKLGVFLFVLSNQQSGIEFCHNEMDGCINLNANDNGYMCDIELIPDTGFEFHNFTLRNCQSYAPYGGSLGLWATSFSSNPIMSFFNCRFINNFRRSTKNDHGGGGISTRYRF